jgi:hypothetical protein
LPSTFAPRYRRGHADEEAPREVRSEEGSAQEGRAQEGRAQEGRAQEGRAQEGRAQEGSAQEGRAQKAAPKKAAPKKAAPKKATAASTSKPEKKHRVFTMSFGSVYPLYVQKAANKGRTKAEVDTIITWLTGYNAKQLQRVLDDKVDFEHFFGDAPALNKNVGLITGVVCGMRVEDIEDPLMQKIRWLDKLIDELARGKKMESILRT